MYLAGYGYSVDVHDAQFFLDEWSTLHYIILAYLLMKSPWYILLIHSLIFSYSEPNTHPHPPFLWPLFISPAHISYHPLQILTRA